MKKVIAIVVICLACLFFLMIGGCSYVNKAISIGAGINDEALNAAEFTICQGATVGSIRRHYGSDEQARIWRELCDNVDDDSFNPGGTD